MICLDILSLSKVYPATTLISVNHQLLIYPRWHSLFLLNDLVVNMDQSFVRNVVINRFWIYQPQVVFMQTMYYIHVKLKFEPLSFVEEWMPLEYPDKNPSRWVTTTIDDPQCMMHDHDSQHTTHGVPPTMHHPRPTTHSAWPTTHDLPTHPRQ